MYLNEINSLNIFLHFKLFSIQVYFNHSYICYFTDHIFMNFLNCHALVLMYVCLFVFIY